MRLSPSAFAATLFASLAAVSAFVATPAHALDKQGSAHGGDVDGVDKGFHVSGAALLGMSLYNPTYGARPDNSGLALMRYAAHLDIDLIGRRLSIPIDVNMFTDRQAGGARKFAPSELDLITGLTTTIDTGKGALELGLRYEVDGPVDQGGYERPRSTGTATTQKYVDARARYLYSFAELFPKLGKALAGGDVSGWLTLGWFAINPSYFARPDNSGKALLRYAVHTEFSVFDDLVSLGLDATMFTDRRESNVLRPSELDFTPEVILRKDRYELHVAYERDMPIDRGGLVQQFVYVLAVVGFDTKSTPVAPLESRSPIQSP